ncbi:ATPase domain protein [Oleidesulfovibrio alaskensis G20]|jgi:cellulose biosynthesis protein BcsQ|uniref:ATPase domain protein n=1 Tax=Oleidesulfovibrio alaskensis (strain ATCC BAA-1058 / DSM 17464 / G20) TaxID=207559 RepID=Q30UV4_OLEA2|nr:ParA family protein [Oleidesulfovibrio alaskensis]ABB40542.2 ATPase domain protein [Oleidesulfovibrio alaskensis G20]
MNYGVWNNKGGVGKSFLSFTLALEHAHRHPERKILLADMCPQANLSEIILGGNGKGNANLEARLAQDKRKTIGGYFDERIASPHQVTGNETSYLIAASDYNQELPDNVYLLCGDPSLELQAQVINQIGSQTLPADAWKNVHMWLKDLINACARQLGREGTSVFIDCNPSFSAYTELAIVASDRLILPCSCDGSSARAVHNVENLVFDGSAYYGDKSFSKMCERFGMALPVIHSVVLNRSTLYNKDASKAFSAMFDEIKRTANDFYKRSPGSFVAGGPAFMVMPDNHSVAIVSSHLGKPLYAIKPGKYQVYEVNPQINPEPLNRYKEAIEGMEAVLL